LNLGIYQGSHTGRVAESVCEEWTATVDCQNRLGSVSMNWTWSHYPFETELFSA
jgi:hypothetical protein